MFPKYNFGFSGRRRAVGDELLAPAGLDLLDVACAAAMWARRICGHSFGLGAAGPSPGLVACLSNCFFLEGL